MLQCRVCMGLYGYGASVCIYIERGAGGAGRHVAGVTLSIAQPGTQYLAV